MKNTMQITMITTCFRGQLKKRKTFSEALAASYMWAKILFSCFDLRRAR